MAATVHELNRWMLPRRIGRLSRHTDKLLLQHHNVQAWGRIMSLMQHIRSISQQFSQYIKIFYLVYQNILDYIYNKYVWYIHNMYMVYTCNLVSISKYFSRYIKIF